MLAEVAASRISTAELEMQAAPAVAAAVGGIVLTGTGAPKCHDPSSITVMTLASFCGNRHHVAAYRERLYRERLVGRDA